MYKIVIDEHSKEEIRSAKNYDYVCPLIYIAQCSEDGQIEGNNAAKEEALLRRGVSDLRCGPFVAIKIEDIRKINLITMVNRIETWEFHTPYAEPTLLGGDIINDWTNDPSDINFSNPDGFLFKMSREEKFLADGVLDVKFKVPKCRGYHRVRSKATLRLSGGGVWSFNPSLGSCSITTEHLGLHNFTEEEIQVFGLETEMITAHVNDRIIGAPIRLVPVEKQ